jgi:hypothetical protein
MKKIIITLEVNEKEFKEALRKSMDYSVEEFKERSLYNRY